MDGVVCGIVEYLYSSLDTLFAPPPPPPKKKYSMTSNEYFTGFYTLNSVITYIYYSFKIFLRF